MRLLPDLSMRSIARGIGTLALGIAVSVSCGRGPFFGFGDDARPASLCEDVEADDANGALGPPPVVRGDCADLDAGLSLVCSDPGDCGPLVWCNPRDDVGSSGPFRCCSDDPAAREGGLPDYEGRGIDGTTPYFSGVNNDQSISGICVRPGALADTLREDAAAGCPIPCNPTWSSKDIETVCGIGRGCRQTVRLDPLDCIIDSAGLIRPVTGHDVGEHSDWNPGAHRTHQDPIGLACRAYGDSLSDPGFRDCVDQLSVANQRGVCVDRIDGCISPDYIDPCEAMN